MYISSAFERLYPDGVGFPETHELGSSGCVRTDFDRFGIAYIADLFARASYGVPFDPQIFAQDIPVTRALWPLYAGIAQKTATGSVLVAVDDALTFGSILYAGPADGRAIVYETHRPNDRPATTLASPDMLKTEGAFDFSNDADYLFLTSAGSFNYGHFLVDDLPRMKAVETLRALNGGRRVVVLMITYGTDIDRVRENAVRRIADTSIEIRFLAPSRTYRFERLHYATPVSVHPVEKNPLAVDYVVQTMTAAIGVNPDPRAKLMIARKSANSRSLLNQSDLVTQLKQQGFEFLHPEDLSFDEQVRRFADACVVVGQMGAAMTNTMFASSAAKLVYLVPEGWIEPFYWDLALSRQQDYRAVYGSVMTPDVAAHNADFVIPIDELMKVIAQN